MPVTTVNMLMGAAIPQSLKEPHNMQAYGARNYAAVGVTLQRALLICLVALAWLLPLWLSMEPVLLALGEGVLKQLHPEHPNPILTPSAVDVGFCSPTEVIAAYS